MLRKKRAGLDDKQFGKALMKTSGAGSRNIPKKLGHEQCEFPYIINYKAQAENLRKIAIDRINAKKKKDIKKEAAEGKDEYDIDLSSDGMDYDIVQEEPVDQYYAMDQNNRANDQFGDQNQYNMGGTQNYGGRSKNFGNSNYSGGEF